ncbi:MAG TPA: very short patch repair endonuclease [Thermoanaerobaculia bacterium]|nr:very short patch repair endonuclease [Thermoanaerobaculia bacterium]
MTDSISPEARSRNMQRIRSKDTAPELAVRRALHGAGLRFRLHQNNLPGKPDLVLRKYRTVVFVHGCFWHQHPNCIHFGVPSSNQAYWAPKLERTAARDKAHREALEALGWRVLVIWECEAGGAALAKLARKVRRPLRPRAECRR